MSNIAKYIVAALITAVVLFLTWYFSNIVAFILVSAVLAIIGKPVVDFLTRLHIGKARLRIPRWLAALITLIGMWLVVVGFFWLFVPILFQKIAELSSLDISEIIASFQAPLLSAQEFIENAFSVTASEFSIVDSLTSQINSLLNINALNSFLGSTINTIGNTVIAVFSISFITFFFLKESSLFHDMVVMLFPKKYEQNISHALNSITNLLSRYFAGIVAESSIMTFLVTIGLLIFGFSWQNSLTIGLFVGVLNVIPYLGPIIGIAIGLFIGILGGAGPEVSMLGVAMRIAGIILSAQLIDNIILQPVLYSNRAKAHPLEIFLVLLIAGSVGGVWGMILAVPTYNVLRVFAKEFFNNLPVVQKLTKNI